MKFTEAVTSQASAFAAALFEAGKHLSAVDLKMVLAASVSGLPLSAQRLEELRLRTLPSLEGFDRVLFFVAAFCELDRVTGHRQLPPLELVDFMSHLFLQEKKEESLIVCHADNTLPLAAWYAAQGFAIAYMGDQALIPHIRAIAGNKAEVSRPRDPYHPHAVHLAMYTSGSHDNVSPMLRLLIKSGFQGGGILTNWSFLSTANPSQLQLKQRLVSMGALLGVIQFPAGIMHRMLPALLLLGPSSGALNQRIRLVNAKDWAAPGPHGIMEITYLIPILAQVYSWPKGAPEKWAPRPPAEEVSAGELLQRQCDLRMREHPLVQQDGSVRTEPLGGCAALVRGQMLAKAPDGLSGQSFCEVLLADIDEYGFVRQASRMVEDAAPLPKSRKVARLRPNDILLTCKGSLQSLGKVGLVTECRDNWLPSQTFYLIRTECLDPIWLFYFLRSEAAQGYIKTHSSGTSIPQIQVADIAAINVPIPDADTLTQVHEWHQEVVREMKKLEKLKTRITELIRKPERITVQLRQI